MMSSAGKGIPAKDEGTQAMYALTATVEGTKVEQEFAEFADAREAADKLTLEAKVEVKVTHESGILVHNTTPVQPGEYFKPYERVEGVPATFSTPAFPGKTLAYTRKRIHAAAYRHDDKSGWTMVNTKTGEVVVCANTTEGRHVFTKWRLEAAAEVAAAKEAEAPVEA